jgi:predicted outer membrane repeat protein
LRQETVSSTKVNRNHAVHDGGGIYNEEFLTISGSQVEQNSAGTTGGGIYNQDSVTLSRTAVVSNTPNNCAPRGSVAGCIG